MDDEANKLAEDAFELFLPTMHAMAVAVGLKVDAKFATFDARAKNEATFRAVETQTTNPSMASTPLPRAVAKAEAATYDARARAFKATSEAISAFLAYSALKNEAAHKQARLQDHWRQQGQAAAAGLYDEAKRFVGILREHGISRWHFQQVGQAQIAIIADLIRWYAKDLRLQDPASPWLAIDALYANRTLRKPDNRLGDIDQQSEAGAPPPRIDPRSPDRFYRYGPAPREPTPVTAPTPVTTPTPVTAPTPVTTPTPVVANENGFRTNTSPGQASVEARHDSKTIAKLLFDNDRFWPSLHWIGTGLNGGEFDPDILVPALETAIASGQGWSGTQLFLAAAKAGNSRIFIANWRRDTIASWATQLEAGDDEIVQRARDAGLWEEPPI